MKYIQLLIVCLLPLLSRGQQWKVGDVYTHPDDHSRGVVFWISPEGTHGWVVKLYDDAVIAEWGVKGVDVPELENQGSQYYFNIYSALCDTAGYANTRTLRNFQGRGNKYAAQVVDFDQGWYLPAGGQLRKLYSALSVVNPALVAAGGAPIGTVGADDMFVYYSSTEAGVNYAWCVAFMHGQLGTVRKDTACRVRAIRTFSIKKAGDQQKLTYQWNTGERTSRIEVTPEHTTDYSVQVSTAAGCSVRGTKKIFVAEGGDKTVYDTICQGEVYRKHGFEVAERGRYTGVLTGAGGCDQRIILNLEVNEPVYTWLTDTINEGKVYTDNNFEVWMAGIHTQKWRAASGCDSIVTLDLSVFPPDHDTIRASVCPGEVFEAEGFRVDREGCYTHTLKNSWGGDSLVTLVLDWLPASVDTLHATITAGEVFRENGFEESEPGIYPHYFRNQAGCDSIVVLNLKVLHTYRDTIHTFICPGEVYEAGGFRESEAGWYTHTYVAANGCDSLVTLDLQWYPSPDDTVRAWVCSGETYTGYGFRVKGSGIYTHREVNRFGCDSLMTLILEEYELHNDTVWGMICPGEVYRAYGFQVSAPGIYTHRSVDRKGCDSLMTLVLGEYAVYQDTVRAVICAGEVYTEHGFQVAQPGVYDRLLNTVYGCDSLVTLVLEVVEKKKDTVRAMICEGETFVGQGFHESVAGRYTHLYTSASGCDSLVTLDLTVAPRYVMDQSADICEGESYAFQGQLYTESGYYVWPLQTQQGCDSIFRLDLQVHPVHRTIIDTVICEGEVYEGQGFRAEAPGSYQQQLQTVWGCDSVVILQLEVENKFRGEIERTLTDCHTHEYAFQAQGVATPGTKWTWHFGDGQVATEESPYHSYADSGLYRVQLEVAGRSCRTLLEKEWPVPFYDAQPLIYAEPAVIDQENPRVYLRTDTVAGLRYVWELGDGNRAAGMELWHTYEITASRLYQIRLETINAEDCRAEAYLDLQAYAMVVIPNTFSPNDDGFNDFFMAGYKVRIMNRNGVEIFRGDEGWDGTYKGKPAPEDTYFYELWYPTASGMRSKTGYITVVR